MSGKEFFVQSMAPLGWYPDPTDRHESRYWSGDGWTKHVANAGAGTTESLVGDVLDNAARPDPTASGFPSAEGSAYYRVGPCDPGIPLFTMMVQTSGTLQLGFGHLRFSTSGGRIVFDVLLSELHSLGVGELGTAIDVWHGDKRHRVSLAGPPEIMLPSMAGANLVVGSVAVASGVGQVRREKETTRAWRELLEPYIAADPPAGVKVRRPMGNVAYNTSVMLVVLLATAVICGMVFAATIIWPAA